MHHSKKDVPERAEKLNHNECILIIMKCSYKASKKVLIQVEVTFSSVILCFVFLSSVLKNTLSIWQSPFVNVSAFILIYFYKVEWKTDCSKWESIYFEYIWVTKQLRHKKNNADYWVMFTSRVSWWTCSSHCLSASPGNI